MTNPRKCYNCQKCGHFKEICSRKLVCIKCEVHEPDHKEETYQNNLNCHNCIESHRVDSKHCKIWEKEREILKFKVTQNITFLETRRLVEIPFIKPNFEKIQMKTKNGRIDKPNE